MAVCIQAIMDPFRVEKIRLVELEEHPNEIDMEIYFRTVHEYREFVKWIVDSNFTFHSERRDNEAFFIFQDKDVMAIKLRWA